MPAERRALWLWCMPPMVGIIVMTLLAMPLLVQAGAPPSEQAPPTIKITGHILERVATMEANQTKYGEQVVEVRSDIRELRTEFHAFVQSVVGGLSAAVLAMGGFLWSQRKR
jgi:hypothetical protein